MSGATPFTNFVQVELPKRPVLPNDVELNSVMIRSGAAPRQLAGVKLEDGQILMCIEGTIQAIDLADVTGDTDNHAHVQSTPSATWTVQHNGASLNCIVTVLDENNRVVTPDEISYDDENTITVTFLTPVVGRALVVYF